MGCGAKRTFHLQIFATNFADGLGRFLTVRYVNAKNNRNLTGSPMGCGAKRTFHLQNVVTCFADELGAHINPEAGGAHVNPEAEGAHINPEAEGAHVNPEAEGAHVMCGPVCEPS